MYIKYFFLCVFVICTNSVCAQEYSIDQLMPMVQNGDRWAQYEMGLKYYHGNGVQQNYAKAVEMWKISADQNYKHSQSALGYCYEKGLGVEQDFTLAANYYEKAALQHQHSASLFIGKWYYHGINVPKLPNKAFGFLKDAAWGGISEGKYYLACCYMYGYGVQKDSAKAILWFNRAADSGYTYAYYEKAMMYEYGRGVSKNLEKAYMMLVDGALTYGDSYCYNELATYYLLGKSVEIDTLQAIEYYEQAANKENTFAMRNLANIYLSNSKYNDLRKAAQWCEKAAEYQNIECFLKAVDIYDYLEDDFERFRIIQRFSSVNVCEAINLLAYCYAKGRGTTLNYNLAIETIDKAIALAPTDPNYYDSKGEILLMMGQNKKAKQMWEKAKSISPNYYKEQDTELNQAMMSKK